MATTDIKKKKYRPDDTQKLLFKSLNIVIENGKVLINPDNKPIEVIVFDTETSGLSSKTDFLLQLSGQRYRVTTEGLSLIDEFDSYLNWGDAVKVNGTGASKVNGITDEILAEAPPAKTVIEKWNKWIDGCKVFAGYNSNFDISFISETNNKLGYGEWKPEIHLDVLVMTKDIVVSADSHKLSDMANHFSVADGIDFHNSLADVTATAKVMECCIEEYGFKLLEETAQTEFLIKPQVKRLAYWKGFKGMSRIYIDTDVGTFFYDIRSKSYGLKPDSSPYEIDDIDMAALREAAFNKAGVGSDDELARYR